MSRLASWLQRQGDLQYLKNRLIYLSLSQPSFIGEMFPSSDVHAVFPQDQCISWDLSSLPQGSPTQHPWQPGLWAIPGALSASETDAISSTITHLTNGNRIQGGDGVPVRGPVLQPIDETAAAPSASIDWEWYSYGPARTMVPLQPIAGICDAFAIGPLSTLKSHNSTDARSWPRLTDLACSGGAALRRLEALPVEAIPSAFAGRPPLFLQVQGLERGAHIGAHIDQPDVGGRTIATAVITGGAMVRVGGVAFTVRPGDLYALSGAARDEVDHEVYSDTMDRISVTTRYGYQAKES